MSLPQPIPYPLRMPDELRQVLTERARMHNRSLNAEILDLLQSSLHASSSIDVDLDKLADAVAVRVAEKLKNDRS
jgi:plasmid stability protein